MKKPKTKSWVAKGQLTKQVFFYVSAPTLEEAKEKLENNQWDDIEEDYTSDSSVFIDTTKET